MRGIKFRIWDKAEKVMLPDLNGRCGYEEMCLMDILNDSNYAVMQFTGLLDKNGKEIYEGDILRAGESMYQQNMLVEKHALAFCYIGLKRYASPHCEYTIDTITNEKITQDKHVEVIGDIYSNPELLSAKE